MHTHSGIDADVIDQQMNGLSFKKIDIIYYVKSL